MWKVTGTKKCCATCANWGGNREPVSPTTVEAHDPSNKGKCYAGVFSSCTQGHAACGGTSCSKYQLWSAIRR